jgi:hypothetical protein
MLILSVISTLLIKSNLPCVFKKADINNILNMHNNIVKTYT